MEHVETLTCQAAMTAVPRAFTFQQKVTSLTVGDGWWWRCSLVERDLFSGVLVLMLVRTFQWLSFPKEALPYESVLHVNTDSRGSSAAAGFKGSLCLMVLTITGFGVQIWAPAFLCLCMCGFPPGTPVSSHGPKTRLLGELISLWSVCGCEWVSVCVC